ncbi:MAG: hypothetical protein JWN13_6729, partial [Betaproteobacteria bacterium]|nr:hypothetical protein [Betaproteobacteria bacterium]
YGVQRVGGSNPLAPTKLNKELCGFRVTPFLFLSRLGPHLGPTFHCYAGDDNVGLRLRRIAEEL